MFKYFSAVALLTVAGTACAAPAGYQEFTLERVHGVCRAYIGPESNSAAEIEKLVALSPANLERHRQGMLAEAIRNAKLDPKSTELIGMLCSYYSAGVTDTANYVVKAAQTK